VDIKPSRAIITLVAAGSIIFGAPALGYAQSSSPSGAEYSRFGSSGGAIDYAGMTFADPLASPGFRQDDNDNAVADNDNAFDDNEDTADNGNWNGNDNGDGDFADEAEFLHAAVSDSATEIESGRLAQTRAASFEVRQFGERMTWEYDSAMHAAAEIAGKHGVETAWQPVTDDEVQRVADLAARNGDDFDRAFIQAVVRDQRADIDRYREAKGHMTDDVVAYVDQHLWMLEDQLRAAEDLADRLDIDVD
jgi:putative membrane protein